ncbi:MAG: hypothetical protein ACFHHU_06985 [Porticoccaceae bacterium]
MKLRVIDGGRKSLENKVIKNMLRGQVCVEDLDKLKPWGNLYLVQDATSGKSDLEDFPAQPPEASLPS